MRVEPPLTEEEEEKEEVWSEVEEEEEGVWDWASLDDWGSGKRHADISDRRHL